MKKKMSEEVEALKKEQQHLTGIVHLHKELTNKNLEEQERKLRGLIAQKEILELSNGEVEIDPDTYINEETPCKVNRYYDFGVMQMEPKAIKKALKKKQKRIEQQRSRHGTQRH